MRKPSLLAGASLADLEQLTKDYPFSSITHLLYIKALSEQKSLQFHSTLKFTAAHVSDRSVLFYLLNNAAGASPFTEDTKDLPVAQPQVKAIPDIKPQEPPTEITEENPEGMDALIQKVRALSSKDLPALEDLTGKLTMIRDEHEKRVEEISQAYLALREIALEEEVEEEIEDKEEDKDEEKVEAKVEVEEKDEEKKEEEVKVKEKEEAVPIPKEKKQQTKKADLIDKFIETAPSMPKPKKDFFSATNMAQHSTMDKEDLVSETLAFIHLKQGNIQKALKIYQRLCLIIPEKSTYFAAQIEKIKKENNLL